MESFKGPPLAVNAPTDSGEIRAVIDVGTNSVKLLIASVTSGRVVPLLETAQQTRLGRNFYSDYLLKAEGIKATAETVGHFASLARERGAISLKVIATSAAREAKNVQDLIAAIEYANGGEMIIISAETEARWAYRGVVTHLPGVGDSFLIVDIGGGSTEFIIGRGVEPLRSASFELGSVRMLENALLDDPPGPEALMRARTELRQFFAVNVLPVMLPASKSGESRLSGLIVTGGTGAILARIQAEMEDYNRDRIEAARFDRQSFGERVEQLWSMKLAQRQALIGLPSERADVILFGAAICEAVLNAFELPEMRVSTRGMRFGAVLDGD